MRPDLLPTTFDGKIGRIIEECGEVLQAIGKMQRFGLTAKDPKTGIEYDNLKDLNLELDDLRAAITAFKCHKD